MPLYAYLIPCRKKTHTHRENGGKKCHGEKKMAWFITEIKWNPGTMKSMAFLLSHSARTVRSVSL